MKLKVNVFESPSGGIFFEKSSLFPGCTPIGTTELDIEPVKKEVVKEEIPITEITYLNDKKIVSRWIPIDAYDVKLVYKVKE